jgi:peptidoglycan L-alanyl-D-glutamate endopeptidase CwlK
VVEVKMKAFSARSEKNLVGVHSDLVRVMRRALEIAPVDFMVIEGLRTVERQKQLVAKGASQTMRSRHLTGHAVDIAPVVGGTIRWDWPLYDRLAVAVKQAAREVSVQIEWGGDWRTFKDGPHWQLPWAQYPA